jgi:nucleoside-diphosphate-sugar epimerase
MLDHLSADPHLPDRTVILGARGFVGGAIRSRLTAAGVELLAFGRSDIDLLDGSAPSALRERLRDGDALVVVSAQAPCKTRTGLLSNLRMVESVCAALEDITPSQVIYVSSDAVYRDSLDPLREDSCADAQGLHGLMHRAREAMLLHAVRAPLAILRPSLLYGADDPHNGYGPNRFRRTAVQDRRIDLFGDGEEQRDHVFIDDLAELVKRVLDHRSRGVLNVATGAAHSFREVAQAVAALSDEAVDIVPSPRQSPIVHRHFDPTACFKAFPDFHYTGLAEGLSLTQAREAAGKEL